MRKNTIILVGCHITGLHDVQLMRHLEELDRNLEIVTFKEKVKEEPLVFPVRNYDLNFIDPLIYHQEPRVKKPLWFQGSDNVDIRVPGKKQNIKYNQRAKLRNNKHKK